MTLDDMDYWLSQQQAGDFTDVDFLVLAITAFDQYAENGNPRHAKLYQTLVDQLKRETE